MTMLGLKIMRDVQKVKYRYLLIIIQIQHCAYVTCTIIHVIFIKIDALVTLVGLVPLVHEYILSIYNLVSIGLQSVALRLNKMTLSKIFSWTVL